MLRTTFSMACLSLMDEERSADPVPSPGLDDY